MPRFVFPTSSNYKLVFLVACGGAFFSLQAPLALAQRGAAPVGGGAHFGGGGRFAGSPHVIAPHTAVPRPIAPRISVPPPGRAAVPPFRFSGGARLNGFRAPGFGFRTRPIHPGPVLPIIPFPIFFGGPFFGYWPGYGFNSVWWPSCAPFWGWRFGCTAAPYAPYYGYGFGGYIPPYVSPYIAPPEYAPPPSYLYGGEESRQKPQLYLKDGTVYNVTDYWLVNGEIHFKTLDEGGTKSVEHVIPFEDLDLQQTIDVNTRMGFRFVLRNAPIEHYLQDGNEGNPPAETAPPQEN
jgi:hypothetical protein